MDRGCLRASRGMDEGSIRVWDCRHWCSWEPVPQPASKSSKVVSNGSRRLLLRWGGRTFPCVLQAPAVKVKHRPRRGGGRHACPHCLITLGPSAHVLCTSPFTDPHCLAQVHSTTHTTRPSNRLATVVGDHAPTVLKTFHRPLFPNITDGPDNLKNATAPVTSRASDTIRHSRPSLLAITADPRCLGS